MQPDAIVGPYRIVGRLGAGGMGEVWLAHDSRLERDVALKTLPQELARDPDQLARFRREALSLASLNHPNIATIHGFEELPDGTWMLVLERVEGESLAERIGRGALPVEETLHVCVQIAEALEVAHVRGIVHRDLKPGNVMLAPRGLVKVLDFGLAKTTHVAREAEAADGPSAATAPARAIGEGEADLTQYGLVVGTPGYMSPEQVLGIPIDARSDIFAFGCVLYESLTGARAFPGTTETELLGAALHGDVDASKLPARLPGRVRELLVRCLDKVPDRRPAGMQAVRIEIEEILGTRRASALRAGEAAGALHNLPQQPTSFVGREDVLEECARRLAETRLLTLSGMGGSGKTRVALKLAEARLADFPDGVWFADLAPLGDPGRVIQVVAEATGVREQPGRPLADVLVEHLATRRTLILLDNCEHLVTACAALATTLLTACPDVRVLATSREALGVAGETLVALPTLALPTAADAANPQALARYESVRLFLERAAQVRPGFALDATSAGPVAEICRRLDGIPLAIELAAARVRVLGVAEISARLDDRFRLLTGGSRTALPRQQTLRATIQWSEDQLSDPERDLLHGLSVFAGGWTLETALAVCAPGEDEFEVLDLLTRLVEKSLVIVGRADAGSSRYRFLESVRQFAQEKLGASPRVTEVRDRHLELFLQLAESAERPLTGPDQARWVDALDVEHENLLAALAASPQLADGVEKGLRLAGAIARFWSTRGQYEIGRRALEAALGTDAGAGPTPARAKALVRAGALALYQGEPAAARPWIEESLAIYRTLGDRHGEARSLSGVASVAMTLGDREAARASYEESVELYRALGIGRGVAVALHNLAYLAYVAGDLDRARELFEEALKLFGEAGDQEHIALTQGALASVMLKQGNVVAARAQFAVSLEIARNLGARREAAYVLEGLSSFAESSGQPLDSARFQGAAESLRTAMGSPALPAERDEREAILDRLRAAVGEGPIAEAMEEGRRQSFEEAVEGARAWLEAADQAAPAG